VKNGRYTCRLVKKLDMIFGPVRIDEGVSSQTHSVGNYVTRHLRGLDAKVGQAFRPLRCAYYLYSGV
jgi:hypothetical protein